MRVERKAQTLTLEMVRETKDAECTDLSGEGLNEGIVSYPNLIWTQGCESQQ